MKIVLCVFYISREISTKFIILIKVYWDVMQKITNSSKTTSYLTKVLYLW